MHSLTVARHRPSQLVDRALDPVPDGSASGPSWRRIKPSLAAIQDEALNAKVDLNGAAYLVSFIVFVRPSP